MSQSVTISDSVFSVAALLRAGDVRTARQQWRETLRSAEPHECAVLAECGRILAEHPRTAPARLRDLWRRSDEQARTVIVACAPVPGEQRARPEPEPDRTPRWNRSNRYQAPSTVHREVRPELRRAPRWIREESRAVTTYMDTRAGVDDAPQRAERPDGYAIDYDNAAKYPVRGRPCIALGCNIEPSSADRAHGDGLCQECRELGRPGIAVPDNATRTQAIGALCAYVHQHYPRALDHLRAEWGRYSDPADRDTVATWVAANVPQSAEDTAAPELSVCQTCGEQRRPRDVRHLPADDGECAECRSLVDSVPSLASVPSAVDGVTAEPDPAPLAAA